MEIQKAYDEWSASYDRVGNPTRDLDERVTRVVLGRYGFEKVIELGCGTGKNTGFLAAKAGEVWGVDFSIKMLERARDKIKDKHVHFIQADVLKSWDFCPAAVDLVTSCLVLEHIEDLNPVFSAANRALSEGGRFYICELHPIKQYIGSKARFEKDGQVHFLGSFVHHISDYLDCAKKNGFQLLELEEWFDQGKKEIPRLVSFVFTKKQTRSR